MTYARGIARSISTPDGLDFLRAVLAATDDTDGQAADSLRQRGEEVQRMLEAAAPGEARLHFTDVFDGILAHESAMAPYSSDRPPSSGPFSVWSSTVSGSDARIGDT